MITVPAISGLRLKGKIAIVTGAGSIGPGLGNGKACAVLFAREGAQVLLVDRSEAAVYETKALIDGADGECHAVVADMSSPDGVEVAVGACLERFGGVDILQNNVGIGILHGLLDLTEREWDLVFRVNVKSMFMTSQSVVPAMRERGGGSIVNVSSVASIRSTGINYPAYAASKAAVNQLTQSVAVEHAADNIRCNVVVVGYMDTPTVYAGQAKDSDERVRESLRERRMAAPPMGRMGDAWDVARASLFLASDESSYITGTQLVVDGGLTAVCDR
jgi:NAD(P)-dependent dehydrogenase (short-subunit alcohol dehydrogenase family)